MGLSVMHNSLNSAINSTLNRFKNHTFFENHVYASKKKSYVCTKMYQFLAPKFIQPLLAIESIRNLNTATLLVFIDFCPVQGELLIWSYVTKTFDILPDIIIEYQIQA